MKARKVRRIVGCGLAIDKPTVDQLLVAGLGLETGLWPSAAAHRLQAKKLQREGGGGGGGVQHRRGGGVVGKEEGRVQEEEEGEGGVEEEGLQ